MTFIPADERLILFDMYTRAMKFLTVDELKALKDAGLGTALITTMEWDKFEPSLGKYDYGYIDERLERVLSAGMRALLPIWQVQNSHFPLPWYAQTMGGSIPVWDRHPEYILSPWCNEAQLHALEVMQLVVDHVAGTNVQVISSLTRFGESVMPQDARHFDPWARQSWKAAGLPHNTPDENLPGAAAWIKKAYTSMILSQQAILTEQYREAWFGFHLPKAGRVNAGVDWFEDYIAAIRSTLGADIEINHITYTYFVPSYTGPYNNLPERVKHLRDIGVQTWCGAEYCEGLRDGNGEKAREIGMRGLVVAPCHAYTNHYQLEPWMIEEIRKAAR
ncbi:MAG: beta-galactosidase [Gallionella sp.]|jgi:hypothetical protein